MSFVNEGGWTMWTKRRRRATQFVEKATAAGGAGMVVPVDDSISHQGERVYAATTADEPELLIVAYWGDGSGVSYPFHRDPESGEWRQASDGQPN